MDCLICEESKPEAKFANVRNKDKSVICKYPVCNKCGDKHKHHSFISGTNQYYINVPVPKEAQLRVDKFNEEFHTTLR